jgi:hypothetical protein
MGALVSLLVAEERKDLRAIVLSAPASKNRQHFESAVRYVSEITAPVLLMVERGDDEHIHNGVNELDAAFQRHNKPAKVMRYNRGGGHNLFFTVDYYWPDVVSFLMANN